MAAPLGVELRPLVSDPDSGRHSFEYDGKDIAPSMAVVAALSRVTGRDPMDLDPIQSTLDTDALDALARSPGGSDVVVDFSMAGCAVTVACSGRVTVTLPDC
jgi:hypothetical protein